MPGEIKRRIRIPDLTRAEEDCLYNFCRFWLGVEPDIQFGPGKLRFDVLTQLMAHNGCGGIMFSILEQRETPWPEKEILCFRDHYFSILAANELYLKLAVELSDKARRGGTCCLFFKGLGLIGSAYREAGWRPISDIDVLVPSREHALQLARLAGADVETKSRGFSGRYKEYNRLNSQVPFVDQNIGMEMHFPMPNPALPLSKLIELARSDLFAGESFLNGRLAVPEPAIHLLLLLVHLVNHHLGTRLIWHLDIAALIRLHANDLDWEKAAAYAERIEYLHVLQAVLDSIHSRFGVAIPKIDFSRGKRIAMSQVNHGLLATMMSSDNVLGDRFGGRKIWQSPALTLTKLKTIIFYSLFPLLFNDQPKKWYRFNFGNSRKSDMLLGLLALTFHTVPEKLFPWIRWTMRFMVLPLLSLAVFPILFYFRFQAAGRRSKP